MLFPLVPIVISVVFSVPMLMLPSVLPLPPLMLTLPPVATPIPPVITVLPPVLPVAVLSPPVMLISVPLPVDTGTALVAPAITTPPIVLPSPRYN